MKYIYIFLLIFSSAYSQENFKWEKIDSTKLTKTQLYSKTKQFIAENWRSANSVIQNDDKESGNIILKGNEIVNQYFQLNDHRYTFQYSVKFDFKEKKVRFRLEDVICTDAICGVNSWPQPPVADTYPTEKGMRLTGMSEKNYLQLMSKLKIELDKIEKAYFIFLNSDKTVEDKW